MLKDRVGLVTGGASGIGRATVLAMAAAGAKVLVADVDEEGGEATVRQVREAGGVRRISKNIINVYPPSARAVTRCAWAGDLRVRLS